MPMSRYEIRNEFSLADPELYQTADKDDPEALLEGVAMAGLVGLLRQLGDLAEFAAEIFHNLHEEVVATAARGHGLMVRVQQLEAEIPSIERAFLLQTDHSSFFYHSGVDWHPNIRVDQNLVTQGDLPRFIMDSYEECREPPRLFLLDKFDVAGAGACLKRYTDPSFYKVECTDLSSANMQREKKILKAKRKGPRWKHGEVPETLPVSHAKLHQLFLEERVENGVSNSSSRVKLKRRLNGYPFDTKTGKSYMEKLLRSSSPDHEEFYEVTKDPGPLMLLTNEQEELKSEVTEDRQRSPGTLSVRRRRSIQSSPVSEKIMKPYDIPADDKISRPTNIYPSTEADGITSTHDKGSCESKREDNLLGYHSDDISSEIDYVDAPSTVETEMDTDSEMKVKGVSTSSYSNNQPLASNANEENHYSRSDSQSIGDSISDAGSSSSKKEISNHSSDFSSNSTEKSLYDKTSVEKFPCADIPETGVFDSLSDQKSADEHFATQHYSETMVREGSCTGLDEVTIHNSDFEHLNYSMSSGDSPPIVPHSDSSEVVRKDSLSESQLHGIVSNHDEVKQNTPITDPHSSSFSDSDPQKGDDYPGASAGELPLSESDCKNMHLSSASEDLPVMIFPNNQQPGNVDRELIECPENLTAKPDMFQNRDNFKPWLSSEEDIKDEIECESLNVSTPTENELSNIIEASLEQKRGEVSRDQNYHVEDHHTSSFIDNQICSTESNALHLLDSPNWEGANSSVHGRFVNPEEDITNYETAVFLSSSSCEVSQLDESCIKNDVPPSDSAALRDQLYPENLEETAENLCTTPEKFEDTADNSYFTSEKIEEHVENIRSPLENLKEAADTSCSTPEELEKPAVKSHYTLENSEDHTEKLCSSTEKTEDPAEISCCSPEKLEEPEGPMQSSCRTPEEFEEAAGISDTGDTDGIVLCTSPEQEIAELSADLKSPNDVHAFDESMEEKDKAASEDMTSNIPCMLGDNRLPISPNKMDVESMLIAEDSGFDEPGNRLESGFMDEADETKDDTSVLDAVFVSSINNQSEVADDDKPNSHLNSEINCSLDVSHPTEIQPLAESDRLDQEFLDEGGLLNRDFDARLHSNCDLEQPILSEKTDLLPDQLVRNLTEFDEASSFPVNCEQIMDHYSHRDSTEEVILHGKDNLPSTHHGQELQNSGDTKSNSTPSSPISHQEMLELSDHQGASDSSLMFSPLNQTNQFLSELPTPHDYDFNVPLFPNNTFSPDFPPPNPFTGTDQVSLTDLPPLPPLPPVQWRLGKQPLSAAEVSISQKDTSSHELSQKDTTSDASTKQSLVQMVPETEERNSENSMSIKEADTIHQTVNVTLKTESKQLQFVPNDSAISVVNNYSHETVELPPKIENEPIPNSEASATVEDTLTASEVVPPKSSLSMINTSHEAFVDIQPKIENEQKQLETEKATPAEDDGVGNGVRSLKARLPSPLVDDASVLDRSKASLRKVTERVRPELKKVDERDSFLQQIKTKSFNLKPAVPSRLSIRGPSTNLKVAAILEKANAIRQALAGSDEDEDSWSDS